jgi:Leucine-rich repeat (LRR) protein
MMKCDDVQGGSSESTLNCEQFADDLEILSQFPFSVNLDPKQQGPGKSTAILDGSLVVMIQLRQSGSTVPESVFCLKNLQSLDIMNMNFVNGIVPDTLSNLQQLFSLSITNTPITKMTDRVTMLQRLESLTLNNCSLSHMPHLGGMSKLLTVSLPNNRLSKIEGLMNPKSLFLYNNLFTEIPTLTEPEALARLYMNYNPVEDMEMITSFLNITEVRLSNTKISVIPPEIDELTRLSFLDVSASQLTHIPKTIFKLTKLQYLVIQNNPFSAEEINSIKMEFNTNQPNAQLLI